MPLALLLLALANPGVPVKPHLFEAHLSAPPGLLLPELSASRGAEIYGGVKDVVAGSILIVVGGLIGGLGVWGLIGAGAEPAGSSGRVVFTALGWTGFGIGAVLMLVGIPLLIVGIVKLSMKQGMIGLTLDHRGQLAVAF